MNNETLKTIQSIMVAVAEDFNISSSKVTSVTELKAIQIGSSFGGGLVGLNVSKQDLRDFDAFAYTAMKFYLSPVDKSISQPYLTGSINPLSRLSVLVGVSTANDYEYLGTTLQPLFKVNPLLGLSYDFNRYFSIDLGATLFRQKSLSPFNNNEDIRVGPVLGVNFDMDLFNRISNLKTGQPYTKSLSGN